MKLYVPEDGHESIRQLRAPLVVSVLARVEVSGAIWRKHRSGELDFDDSLLLLRAFAADYAGTRDQAARFIAVAPNDRVVERAAELTGAHGLRAYDAIQLASALAAREEEERCNAFASFDRDLAAAATAEGFMALPVGIEAPPVGSKAPPVEPRASTALPGDVAPGDSSAPANPPPAVD